MIDESLRLYKDIDGCISRLLKARSPYDAEAEMKAFDQMEGLMVGTLQHLSYLIGQLERVEFAKWIEIQRDKDGFIAEQSKEDMYNNLPLIIWDSKYKEFEAICEGNWCDWLHDLEKPRYSHYMPIVPPKED